MTFNFLKINCFNINNPFVSRNSYYIDTTIIDSLLIIVYRVSVYNKPLGTVVY